MAVAVSSTMWISNMLTSELTGAALDWAVAKCEERTIKLDPMGFKKDYPTSSQAGYWIWEDDKVANKKTIYQLIGGAYSPSTNWLQGGPIIEREKMNVLHWTGLRRWAAKPDKEKPAKNVPNFFGDTLLEAAMRCYVASKLGNELEVPESLQGS